MSHGNTGRQFQVSELLNNLAALGDWSRAVFEVPDVIHFADYILAGRRFAEAVSSAQSAPHRGTALAFPYPNTPKKLRQLTVLTCVDLVLLRAAAGRIAATTERLLSSRCFGYRVDWCAGGWRFKDYGKAWKEWVDQAVHLLRSCQASAMCATDVASYYASIDLERLEDTLRRLRCDRHAAAVFLGALQHWHSAHGLTGLPIGPEASGVLGNLFLMPVDAALEAHSAAHFRWMDDVKILGPHVDVCRALLDRVREAVERLGLHLSLEKTEFFDTPGAAIARLRDPKLDSLGFWLKLDVSWTTDELHKAFDQHICGRAEVDRSRFHYILRALKHRCDPYAAVPLAEHLPSLNTDPRLSADYLAKLGLGIPRVVDAILQHVSQTATSATEGLVVHLSRAMSRKRWGRAEGKVFERIAMDRSRLSPVRCWAIAAHAHTEAWRQKLTMDAAEAELDPLVQRAFVITLRGVRGGRTRRRFLSHITSRFPELSYTEQWLEAA